MARVTRPNAHRERLYALVVADPGIHVRRLAPLVNLSWNCCNSHLRILEREGRLISRKVDGKLCWFDREAAVVRNKNARCVLRDSGHRAVAQEVMAQPGANQVTLAQSLRLADSSIHRHLTRLEREGLVVRMSGGRSRQVFPTERLQALMAGEPGDDPVSRTLRLGGPPAQVVEPLAPVRGN